LQFYDLKYSFFPRTWDPHTFKEKDKVEIVNRRAARMVSNDYGRHSSVTSMLTRLGWATLEQRRENQRLTMMYKVVHGLVAVPTTRLTAQQIPAPEPTTVISFGLSVAILRLKVFLLSANHSFLEPPTSRKRRSYVRRCIQASSSVVPPFISIGVSLPRVCRLLSRSRSRSRLWHFRLVV